MLKKSLHGNNKYFLLSILFVVITLFLELFSPYLVHKTEDNWDEILSDRVENIKFSVIHEVREKEEKIADAADKLIEIIDEIKPDIDSSEALFKLLSGNNFEKFDVEIYNTDVELIAWNGDKIFEATDIVKNKFEPGEDFFHTGKLVTYLSRIDTFSINRKIYLFAISLPFEKHFRIQDKYFNEKEFIRNLEDKFQTSFKIDYSPESQYSLDGRDQSFEILNNFNKKIGLVTFEKPLKVNAVSAVSDFKFRFQAVLIILAYLLLGFRFLKFFNSLKSAFLKFLILFLYGAGLRIIFFLVKFPSFFFGGELNNPAYFSSKFVFGIVRSPLEFFVSTIILLAVIAAAYRFTIKYYFSPEGRSGWIKFIPALFFYTFLFLVSLRGFETSIQSVIFDSTLLYFKEKNLIPIFPAILMQLNILILGVTVLTFTSITLILIFKRLPEKFRTLMTFSLLFLFFQIAGMLYDILQLNPQGTHLIRIIYISLSFIIAYVIIFTKQIRSWTFVYITFAASFISITLLNHYNAILEKESVQMISAELAQPRENWIDFLINETLNFAREPEKIYPVSNKKEINYNALSFSIWSRSSLKRESLVSAVVFLDSTMKPLGKFSFDLDLSAIDSTKPDPDKPIIWVDTLSSGEVLVIGSAPVNLKNEKLYLTVTVLESSRGVPITDEPDFLVNNRLLESASVNAENLLIFKMNENNLQSLSGDLNLSPAQLKYIYSSVEDTNSAWINLINNNEIYSAFVIRNGDDIYVSAQKAKELSWSLYDFFKVFFVHSIFIIVLIFILLAVAFSKSRQIKITFRTQLLVALLLISIIPLVLLAVYFRNLTEEKNDSAIYYKLQKRAKSVEQFLQKYNPETENISDSLFVLAADDLGIDFTIYESKNFLFSSNKNYYEAGLLPVIIYPAAFEALTLHGTGEILVKEFIEDYSFNAFYYKTGIGGNNFVIKVSDSFNNILLPMSATELDTFLFGSYFLAVILIVIMSAFLANQISSPIRKLTIATRSVAGGDLNIEVSEQRRGEIKDLIDGFNMMVKELKKIQSDMAEVEREAAWKEMAKQVAHEIKNPLTPMKLAVQQLVIAYRDKSPKFDEIFDKVTGTVISQIDTLKNIASEFSSFARMPNVKLERVEIVSVAREAINLFIEEKIKIELKTEITEAFINADRDQLKRLLINLIRNSIQANATYIIFELSEQENFYKLKIIDNGNGMPKEIAAKIFQQDFTTKIKGMGLGLTMAKRYIESIKGSIIVEETSGNGTTILLKILKN